ncbi:gluconate operon transcriptional repressor GntR [Chitinilyticum piscinae]|uniref:Gluconate operon transcriptional repressor GntR n=1 Tax=Chitinilyticum piscinae TaxID=2866724 RepID=A0A8J7G107_9NEIS|nr:gluconate operon transcriptional repressor GntR [Chitinilyticum piscinae]MBE9609995.1 gluconate operon transcriptional repressor GntR [Chitinilyticum piscinae]
MSDKPRRPTLQDVADRVGTSKMTISRYLRDPQQVAEATRAQIAGVMAELGYIPSRVPDMLANAKSRAIGVLLPSISNQVFASVVHGIERITQPAGYQCLYAHYGYSAQREEDQIRQLLSFHIDGLILCETVHTDATLRMLEVAAIPVVEVMELPAQPIDQAVGLDHTAAARAMVEAMLARGKRHIAYLAARLDRRTQLREAGYRAAMLAAGLTPCVVASEASSSFSLGSELLRQARVEHPQLDGVFCTNDDIAAGALLAAQAMGLTVPDDLAVAGCNALDIGRALAPPLASIVTPREAIGELAAQRLLARINGERFNSTVIDAGFTLFAGGSI